MIAVCMVSAGLAGQSSSIGPSRRAVNILITRTYITKCNLAYRQCVCRDAEFQVSDELLAEVVYRLLSIN